MTKQPVCGNTPVLSRRSLLIAPAALVVPGASAALPALPPLVERVMQNVTPCTEKHVFVRIDAMRALCEAADVEWAEHWAYRGK